MLKVMNAGTTPGDGGILLNCWGKSSPLIQELEQTVNFAERKCGDLMQQLHFYKEYYEKWGQHEKINNICQKKKAKKYWRQTLDFGSSSENELEEVNQYFYNKLKSKITEMNKEITEANRKLSLKQSRPPPPPQTEPQTEMKKEEEKMKGEEQEELKAAEMKTCQSESAVALVQPGGQNQSLEAIKVTQKQSSKSVPTRKRRDFVLPKRRHSTLQRYKLRSKSLPQGVRRKFGFGGFFEVVEPHPKSVETKGRESKSKTSIKSRRSEGRSKSRSRNQNASLCYRRRRNGARSASSLNCRPNTRKNSNSGSKSLGFPDIVNEEAINRLAQPKNPLPKRAENSSICKDVVVPDEGPKISETESQRGLGQLMSKPNALVPFLRNPIPFIPCSSTSKTFNLGLNVQQVLSLIKRKKHSVTLEAVVKSGIQAARSIVEKPEPAVNTLFFSHTSASHNMSAICPARNGSEDSFSMIADSCCRSKCSILKQIRSQTIEERKDRNWIANGVKVERPEDVWVVDQPDDHSADPNKLRTRCTCFPSKHCVDYHKVLKQYTGWRLPSKRDLGSHYNPMMACNKPNLYMLPLREDMDFGPECDGRIELMKVQNVLINLNRKYSSLQEQIMQNSLEETEANAELDAIESELTVRETEFKDVLSFYNQLMALKEKLKYLRQRSSVQSQLQARPKRDPLRPTPSMALTKILRKIQGLQDKIRLVDAF